MVATIIVTIIWPNKSELKKSDQRIFKSKISVVPKITVIRMASEEYWSMEGQRIVFPKISTPRVQQKVIKFKQRVGVKTIVIRDTCGSVAQLIVKIPQMLTLIETVGKF